VQYPDGYIKIKDRSKDIIISGGENISSIEVEDVLYRHPDVLAAPWWPSPTQVGRDAVRLRRAQGRRAPKPRTSWRTAASTWPASRCPRRWCSANCPKTSTGKIQKFFFASKVEIHQAVCGRMLGASYNMAKEICQLPVSAEERLRRYVHAQYKMTTEVMLDDQKVHEMVIVALERDWAVIDKHIDRIHDLLAVVIGEGIEAGEFRKQDPAIASRCFGAATVILCHPQMVAQCMAKTNRAMPDDLIDYAIEALKN
jgi:hypothetical protein